MARYDDCIQRLSAAAGRALTDKEVEAVFTRIHQAALDVKAGRSPTGEVTLPRGLNKDVKGATGETDARTILQMAAERAAADLERDATKAEFQAHLQLVRMGARLKDVTDMRQAGIAPIDAVRGTLARDYTGKIKVESLEQKVVGYQDYFKAQLLPSWDALGNDFMGFLQDRDKLLMLVRELKGESTGNTMAKQGAEAFHKSAEEARQAYNQNGGSIGKLDDWGFPQHHSQMKVAQAGAQTWIDYVLPILDRTRYADDLGTPRDDATCCPSSIAPGTPTTWARRGTMPGCASSSMRPGPRSLPTATARAPRGFHVEQAGASTATRRSARSTLKTPTT